MLATGGDLLPVVLVPDIHLENGVDNLEVAEHNVALEDFGLPLAVFWDVSFHAIHEEGGHFLDTAFLLEDFSDCVHVDARVLEADLFGRVEGAFRVGDNQISDDCDVVSLDADLLGVFQGQFNLAGFHKAGEVLLLHAAFLIYGHRDLDVKFLDQIAELF